MTTWVPSLQMMTNIRKSHKDAAIVNFALFVTENIEDRTETAKQFLKIIKEHKNDNDCGRRQT